jgi:hypothetical protein
MYNFMQDITGITVSHNTASLLKGAYESVRKFHPEMMIIIVDGSDPEDECRKYVESLESPYTTLALAQGNIGHGLGMDLAIKMVKTKYALIFDSDIVMLKSPLWTMYNMMEPDTYGVGYIEKTGYDGFEYGAQPHHKGQGYMIMLHPFFHLLQVSEYFKFHPYVHHGAPAFLAALDIHKKGLSEKIIKVLPGLGHTHGKGWCWSAVPGEWVLHDTAGTRKDRVKRGKSEIEGRWTYDDSDIRTGRFLKRV